MGVTDWNTRLKLRINRHQIRILFEVVMSIIRFFQRKSVKLALPFLILVVGGSFGLKQFTENRYRFNKNKFLTPPELHKHGIIKKEKSEVTLETEFEKIKKVDFSLAACIPPRNSVIRIWGELELKSGADQKIPLVKAKVSRVIKSIDIPLYRKSLVSRRKFTPHFAT